MCLHTQRSAYTSTAIPLRLNTHLTLPEAGRVRVRFPQFRDRAGLVDLFARAGLALAPLEVQRLLRFDPRERAIVCAVRWDGTAEQIVGIAGISFAHGAVDLLVADDDAAPGLRDALCVVLERGAAAHRAA